MQTTGYDQHKRDEALLAGLRPPVRTTARPQSASPRAAVTPLADVIRMPQAAGEHVAFDGATVQSNHRVVLRNCCDDLGWDQGTRLAFECGDGEVTLTADADGDVRIGVRSQLTLTPAMLAGLGVPATRDDDERTWTIAGVANASSSALRLLGPSALADAGRFAAVPRPARDVLTGLGLQLTKTQLTHLQQVLTSIDQHQLAQLAALDANALAGLLNGRHPAATTTTNTERQSPWTATQ